MLQLEQIQWQTDGSALLRLSDSEDARILAFSVTDYRCTKDSNFHTLLEQIQSAGRFREIYKKSMDLLARREHSIWELRQKLRQRFPGFREVELVLLQLEEQNSFVMNAFSEFRSLPYGQSLLGRLSAGLNYSSVALQDSGSSKPASEVDESVLRKKLKRSCEIGFPTDPAAKEN